jgi:hypothetical protein
MAMVLGIHVPELGHNPQGEVCHSFVYRYLVARGNIKGATLAQHDPMQNLMTRDANFLYSAGGALPARQNGVMQPTPGSIVIFRDSNNVLMHSMIAINANTWIGANNTTCFGVLGGRITFNNVGTILFSLNPRQNGWTGNQNVWSLGSVGNNTVTYIPAPVYM